LQNQSIQKWIQIENGQLAAILFFWNHVFNHYSLTIVDRIITCRTKVVRFFFYFNLGWSDLDSIKKWPTGSHFVFQKSYFQPILINYCRYYHHLQNQSIQNWIQIENSRLAAILFFRNHVFNQYSLIVVNRIICRTKVVQLFFYFHFIKSHLDSNRIWPTASHFVFSEIMFSIIYSLTIVDRIITCRTKFLQFLFYFHFVQSDLDSDRKWSTGSHFVFTIRSCNNWMKY